MRNQLNQPRTGLLLSGGVDSAVLLDQLLARGWLVTPFYVRTGCAWQGSELAAIGRFLARLACGGLSDLEVLDMPLADLYGDHWSITGTDVPDDSTPDEAVYLPGRNPLLLIKPVLWCQTRGIDHLALATLSNNPFPDATPAFFERFGAMIGQSVGGHVQIARPFERLTKSQVMELGRHLPLELTFSCLAPVEGMHCGRCNKCAERRAAFQAVRMADKTHYSATQYWPVS
jgi:7-cyano-7-deazaguanine synthase